MARTISRRRAPADDTSTPDDYADGGGNEREDSERRHPARRGPARRPAGRDDRSTRPTGRKDRSGPAPKGSGWGTYSDEKKKGGSGEINRLKVTEDPQIIAFMEEEPFAVFRQHWIKEAEGKQSFVCHGRGECPLCPVDKRKPALRALFNVVDFCEGDPRVVILETGVQLADLIADWAAQEKTSPINQADDTGTPTLYWEISRIETKSNGRTRYQYKIIPVKARDLAEDYDVEPLTAEESEDLAEHCYDDGFVKVDDIEDLHELADALS